MLTPVFLSLTQLFFIIFWVSVLLVRLLIRLNIVAIPMSRSSHSVPTPSAGGLGILAASGLGMFLQTFAFPGLPSHFSGYFYGYGLACLLIGLISFYDDCHPVSYRVRLLVHVLGSVAIILSGLTLKFPALEVFEAHSLTQIVTVFCLVALINAANFLDGLNGLLSGCVLLNLFFMLAMVPLLSTQGLYTLLLIPALLGFFIFNFPKAKIFMGDVGSTFLGLTLGFLALLSQENAWLHSPTAWVDKNFVLSLTPMAFLWFDVGFTLLRRCFLGRRLTEAHRDHLFHLLHDAGYSHATVSGIYFISVLVMGGLSLSCYYGFFSFVDCLFMYMVIQAVFCGWVFKQSYAVAR